MFLAPHIKNTLKKMGIEINYHNPVSSRMWPNHSRNPLTAYEGDEDFHRLYNEAQIKCQMEATDNALRLQRHYMLSNLIKQAPISSGSVCELGCLRGLSAYQISNHLKQNDYSGKFHIFDSFQGLSKIEDEDRSKYVHVTDKELRDSFACSMDQVKENLSEYGFVEYHKGWIPTKFSEVEDLMFSFVHIDVDLYEPIKDSIEFFYPRLVKGGIMLFDDYGSNQFPGAKKAVDESIDEMEKQLFLKNTAGSAFILK